MPPVTCPYCQSSNRHGARFCNECGGRLPIYRAPKVHAPESADFIDQPWLRPEREAAEVKLPEELRDQPWLARGDEVETSQAGATEASESLLAGLQNLLPRSNPATLLGE